MRTIAYLRRSLSRALAILTLVAGGALPVAPAHAQGDLLIAPTRVIINNGGGGEVVLSNIGSEPATYRIGMELRRMTEKGEFVDVAEADANDGEKAALAMITYAPRRITLLPGQPQSVRISARPPAELPDGEYRVHLSFRAVPKPLTPEETQAASAAGGVQIKLTPVYGITIPVFVRKGRLEAGATLANPHIEQIGQDSFMALDLARSGQRSTYGELIGKSARGEVVFAMRGVAIYPEIAHRKVLVPLNAEQVAKVKGSLHIEYRELPENGGQLIAQIDANIQ